MAKSSKNQVVMSVTEKSRAKRMSSPVSSRRSSKPRKSSAFMVEAMEPASVARRVFFIGRKSDINSTLSETKYIVIDGVPHKRVGSGYVALTPKKGCVTPENVMLGQLNKLAGKPESHEDRMYSLLLKISKA